MNVEIGLFYLIGVISVISAVIVAIGKNPVYSAISLLINFLCIGILMFIFNARFLGVVQVIIYAGAIVILILFVIMMLRLRGPVEDRVKGFFGWITYLLGLLFLIVTSYAIYKAIPVYQSLPVEDIGSVNAIGKVLFNEYLLPFETASVLLLVAIIGALSLSRREL